MVSKRKLLGSVLVRRCIHNRLIGLGYVLGYKKRTGELPPVDKEGIATGFKDNGGLFIPEGLVFKDNRSSKINLQRFENNKPSVKELEHIVDTALSGEKATIVGRNGYAYNVMLSNEFFPRVALQIVRGLAIDGRIKITLTDGAEITEDRVYTSFLPPSLPDERIKYGCRTEMAACLAVCSSFFGHYHNLAIPELRFVSPKRFKTKLEESQKPITDNDGNVLVPPYIVHCHNTRLLNKSMGAPISLMGYGHDFGEFAIITFEDSHRVIEDLKLLDKKARIPKSDFLSVNGEDYCCALRYFSKTTPGRRAPRSDTMVVSPTRDLCLGDAEVNEAIRQGYEISLPS